MSLIYLQLFSVLFFLMLFSLGVGSAVSWQMAVITVICDQWPKLKKLHVTIVTCGGCFLLGLVYVTPVSFSIYSTGWQSLIPAKFQGGQQILTLVDNFSGNFVIYILATIEVMAISWIYGLSNIVNDLEFMLGRKIGIYFKFCWVFFVPVFLFVILIYSLVTLERVEYAGVPLPSEAVGKWRILVDPWFLWKFAILFVASGWILATLCLSFVPIFALYEIIKKMDKGLTFYEKFKQSLRPNSEWGPKDPLEREKWLAYLKEKAEN